MAMGAALDFSRAYEKQGKLQQAVDAAAIAAAQEVENTAERDTIVANLFSANAPAACRAAPTIDYGASSVTVTSNCEVPASLLRIAGYNSVPVSASAEAGYGRLGDLKCIIALDREAPRALKIGATPMTQHTIVPRDQGVVINGESFPYDAF